MSGRRTSRDWNGKNVPPELRELPAGRYVVEAIEDEAPALTPEEEAGVEAALESYRQGRVVDSNALAGSSTMPSVVEAQPRPLVAGHRLHSPVRARGLRGLVHRLPRNIGAVQPHDCSAEHRNPEWEHVYCAAVVAANASMRPVEVKHLRRRDVDLEKKLLHVRTSKNETSHRVIPLNASAAAAITRMLEGADLLGHRSPDHYVWPACQWGHYDGTKPMLKWDTAWRALRDAAGLYGLRFHDLRHTAIAELAELGVADHVLESISGHVSRRMLEHYSHIRIDAKRQALDALDRSDARQGRTTRRVRARTVILRKRPRTAPECR